MDAMGLIRRLDGPLETCHNCLRMKYGALYWASRSEVLALFMELPRAGNALARNPMKTHCEPDQCKHQKRQLSAKAKHTQRQAGFVLQMTLIFEMTSALGYNCKKLKRSQ